MEAFPYPPPGDAPSRDYRLPRGIQSGFSSLKGHQCGEEEVTDPNGRDEKPEENCHHSVGPPGSARNSGP
ncbi:hypothetical protein TNCV_2471831 [Trichonephila clavipes]|nr:hypothetical protein TNCV_2471831 [Trichonephila clavipes]